MKMDLRVGTDGGTKGGGSTINMIPNRKIACTTGYTACSTVTKSRKCVYCSMFTSLEIKMTITVWIQPTMFKKKISAP